MLEKITCWKGVSNQHVCRDIGSYPIDQCCHLDTLTDYKHVVTKHKNSVMADGRNITVTDSANWSHTEKKKSKFVLLLKN